MSSNNVGHIISTIITLQHFATLHQTTLHYTIIKIRIKQWSCPYPAMKAHSASRGIAPLIHNLGTMEDGEWSTLRPRTFTPTFLENNPGTYWMWGWISPRVGQNILVKRTISCPYRGSNLGPFFRSQPLYRLRYRGSDDDNNTVSHGGNWLASSLMWH